MKRTIFITLMMIAITASAQRQTSSIPDWYSNPPTSNKKFYGVGAGTSKSLEIAEQKARLEANVKLAEQVNPPKTEEFETNTTNADGKPQKGTVQRKAVEAQLSGVKIVKKEVTQSGDEYTIYVMLEMKKKK